MADCEPWNFTETQRRQFREAHAFGPNPGDSLSIDEVARADWCTETLDADGVFLTCEIAGPHSKCPCEHGADRHEAQDGDLIYAWETGSGEYTADAILSAEGEA